MPGEGGTGTPVSVFAEREQAASVLAKPKQDNVSKERDENLSRERRIRGSYHGRRATQTPRVSLLNANQI